MRQKFKPNIFGTINTSCPLDILHFRNIVLVRRATTAKDSNILIAREVNTKDLLWLHKDWIDFFQDSPMLVNVIKGHVRGHFHDPSRSMSDTGLEHYQVTEIVAATLGLLPCPLCFPDLHGEVVDGLELVEQGEKLYTENLHKKYGVVTKKKVRDVKFGSS